MALLRNSKTLIATLIRYFEQARDHGGPLLPLNAERERVAAALNVNATTVASVSQSVKSGNLLRSPKRTKLRKKPVDGFDQMAIRNTIYDMVKDKQYVNCKTLLQVLKGKDIFYGGLTSLWTILRNLGFRFKKDDPRRGLMELPNIAFARVRFLQEYVKNLKSESRFQCVFLDETWVFENGTVCSSWQDSDIRTFENSESHKQKTGAFV